MIRKLLTLITTTAVLTGLLFVLTNPERLPAAVFIALFIVLYGFCYGVLSLSGLLLVGADILTWSNARIYRTALAVACFPLFLLILQSIGQLTIKDILLTTGLSVILYLYFGRLVVKKPE